MVYYIKSPAAKPAVSIQVCSFKYVHLGWIWNQQKRDGPGR